MFPEESDRGKGFTYLVVGSEEQTHMILALTFYA